MVDVDCLEKFVQRFNSGKMDAAEIVDDCNFIFETLSEYLSLLKNLEIKKD